MSAPVAECQAWGMYSRGGTSGEAGTPLNSTGGSDTGALAGDMTADHQAHLDHQGDTEVVKAGVVSGAVVAVAGGACVGTLVRTQGKRQQPEDTAGVETDMPGPSPDRTCLQGHTWGRGAAVPHSLNILHVLLLRSASVNENPGGGTLDFWKEDMSRKI
ncbi:hypothetical protein Bbelb_030390 [Branchiostoma belcheri]|nr:hypothetical protein Bbelb_030390 [Branchiostoma belcheri]